MLALLILWQCMLQHGNAEYMHSIMQHMGWTQLNLAVPDAAYRHQSLVAKPRCYHKRPLTNLRPGHPWRFSKDGAELRSMKMENVICHVGFKGPFAKREHATRLTERRCDNLGGHELKVPGAAFPTHSCPTPPGRSTQWAEGTVPSSVLRQNIHLFLAQGILPKQRLTLYS